MMATLPALREMSANIRVLFVSYPGRTIVCMSEFDFLSSSVVHRAAVVAGGVSCFSHVCQYSYVNEQISLQAIKQLSIGITLKVFS